MSRVVASPRSQNLAFNRRAEECEEIAADRSTWRRCSTIEHVDDPRACAIVLRRGSPGAFAVETPNVESLDCRLFARTYWGGYHIPHWNLFSPGTLRHAGYAGLSLVATRYQTGHSF